MKNRKPILFNTEMVQAILDGRKTQIRRIVNLNGCKSFDVPLDWHKEAIDHWTGGKCPYGQVGDVIWVRETWSSLGTKNINIEYGFKANASGDTLDAMKFYGLKWKPSIHMPFEACRLFLIIINIRVERLQDISEDDAKNEGIELNDGYYLNYLGDAFNCLNPRHSFNSLWEKINGSESWNANPWVWVIEFKQITKEEALS